MTAAERDQARAEKRAAQTAAVREQAKRIAAAAPPMSPEIRASIRQALLCGLRDGKAAS